MKNVIHKADSRGHADRGWLDAHHTFSFGDYHDPARTHFGVLRVLNDDKIASGMGFPPHPHDNMEIITIPLEGALEHKDSMGSAGVIRKNEIQIMSAGTGLKHSEANASSDEELKLLQIWLFPNQKNVAPRYQQIQLENGDRKNVLQQVISPNADDAGGWIHQDAWFHLGSLEAGFQTTYEFKNPASGLYVFLISGEVEVGGQKLETRDGLGIWEISEVAIKAHAGSEILLMEVPMR